MAMTPAMAGSFPSLLIAELRHARPVAGVPHAVPVVILAARHTGLCVALLDRGVPANNVGSKHRIDPGKNDGSNNDSRHDGQFLLKNGGNIQEIKGDDVAMMTNLVQATSVILSSPRRLRSHHPAMAKRPNDPIEPMTLENMRANGVRSLDVQCNECRHRVIVNIDHLPGDLTVPLFGWSARSAGRSAPTCGQIGRNGSNSPACEAASPPVSGRAWERPGGRIRAMSSRRCPGSL
jgi:hypothetical protein